MNRIFLPILAIAGAVMLTGCSKQDPAAAIVNGEPITMSDFHRYLELKPQVQVIVDPQSLRADSAGALSAQPYSGQVVGSLSLQALNDLVQQAILRQMAKDEGVWPDNSDIEAEIKSKSDENPTYLQTLANAGFTPTMIRNDIAMQLAQINLTTKGVKVSQQEVDDYIKTHPDEFKVPDAVDMTWMLIPSEKDKNAADQELKTGTSFILVAQKYSKAPQASTQQWKFPEQYVPKLAKYGQGLLAEVQKTPEQQQTKWIKFTEGWAKFFINKKTPQRQLPIDDKMKKKVLRALMLQEGAKGKDINLRVQENLRKADVQIGQPLDYLKEPWKRSMDTLQTQLSSTTNTSSGK